MRWRLLDNEEAEIRRVLAEVVQVAGQTGTEEGGEELRVALAKVAARRKMPPGARAAEGSGGLPGYGDRGTVGVVAGAGVVG